MGAIRCMKKYFILLMPTILPDGSQQYQAFDVEKWALEIMPKNFLK